MYPAVPRSTPIYAVVDRTKKKPRSKYHLKEGSKERKFRPVQNSEPNLPDLVTLAQTEVKTGSSDLTGHQSRDLGRVSNDEHEDTDITDITEELQSVTDTVYLSDEGDDTTVTTSEDHSSQVMVKSHSANHSPNFEDLCVIENLERVKQHKKKKIKRHKKGVTDPEPAYEIGNYSVQSRGKII